MKDIAKIKLGLCGALATVACSLFSSITRGDVTATVDDNNNNLTVFRMTVTPAAEPVPALRYRLEARDIDLKPGNAAPYYYRTMMVFRRGREASRKAFDEDKEISRWYYGPVSSTSDDALPLDKLPLEKVKRVVEMTTGEGVASELAEATSRRECNWQTGIEDLNGQGVIDFSLEEFQEMRDLARMLSLRARYELATHHYEDAIHSMRMNYRVAKDTASESVLVCGLIGIAVAGVANSNLIELIAAPNSPNMYWALTELPQPFIDMRPAARFELAFGPRMFPFIHNAETTDHSPQEWNRLFKQAQHDVRRLRSSGGGLSTNDELTATGLGLVGYSYAKAKLIEQGFDQDRVEKMAVGQVIAIYSERITQRLSDEFEKLWYVPYWEMRGRIRDAEQRLSAANTTASGKDREVLPIAATLLPAVQACRTAQIRLERDIAALRVIEALRMYAATHDGSLPAALTKITEVPVPANPATGQPFAYRLEGKTAILDLPASDGIQGYYRRFEVQIAAKSDQTK